MKKSHLMLLSSLVFLAISAQAHANTFSKIGKIKAILSDVSSYGGCMLQLNVNIAEGCPNNGYVALDCDAVSSNPGIGNRHLATSLVAASLDKEVYLIIDNAKKINGYCVATRVITLF